MKNLLFAFVTLLIGATVLYAAGWDQTITDPQPTDTVQLNDLSQPGDQRTQYTEFQNFPVSNATQTELDNKMPVSSLITLQPDLSAFVESASNEAARASLGGASGSVTVGPTGTKWISEDVCTTPGTTIGDLCFEY